MIALSVEKFKELISDEVMIIDTRSPEEFSIGFIPNSIFIGNIEPQVAHLLPLLPSHKGLLVVKGNNASPSYLNEQNNRLLGYLDGGFDTWKQASMPLDMIIDIEADELKMDMNYDKNIVITDVRTELEFKQAHVTSAFNLPIYSILDTLTISQFEDTDNIYLYSEDGYLSLTAASLLKRQQIHNLRNVLGGFKEISQVPNMPITHAKEMMN